MESSYSHVRPISPLAGYVGGKRALASTLVDMIDSIDHKTYAEPFVGMGGVFLRRTLRPRVEIINDLSGDIATLFRVLQRHYAAFLDMMRFYLTTRAEFDRLCKVDPETLTDLERAARFLYLQRTSYGGKVTGRTFGVDASSPSAFNMYRLGPIMEALHERLSGVVIERLPYDQLLSRYDADETLFFLDPPYYGSEDYYGKDLFLKADFLLLADCLKNLKGGFLLTINDCVETRAAFAGWPVKEVSLNYSLGRSSGCSAREIIIASDQHFLSGKQNRLI
ncbi:DNA methyltransferase [Iodidimonas nitroreducens]|uniref:site-specific DNA-methyltransferase (adenine-specific) n=1 Tax=Iodidimonas nitroreducens TaxID=1236968 RepID=A0A5A7N787_9PROT|nr:DNA adenine methylase [Iodidimonas nitroreducens]GAK33239.1 modification methylase CviBI [alpha proteobacterium Q-1]GER04182.1 DNA methyltransferase [Iodidimonas nitroreducens]